MRTYQELLPIIRERLGNRNDSHRFRHTLGVVETAEKLAVHYQADVEKAKIAALIHDATKHDDVASQEKRIREYFGEAMLSTWPKQLYHGFSAVGYAKNDLKIDDEEILKAIQNHSVGRPGMSLLEKIIFAADYLEPGRGLDNEEVRKVAYVNLNKAIVMIIVSSLDHVTRMGYEIVPLSIETLRYYEKHLEDNE
jgi:predicted HD superfamily hydrolase involved in NAD metabolism